MKPWYASKTVIFNLLAAFVLVANQLGFDKFRLDAQWEVAIVVIVNLVLRFVTKSPIRV